ncbi:MAG: DUF1512 family protein [Conexivisphaera sp.]
MAATGDQLIYYYLAWYIVLPTIYVALMTVYANKFQFWTMSGEVYRAFRELKDLRDRGISRYESYISSTTQDENARARLRSLLDFFAVFPVDLDPVGIVGKLKHLMDNYERRFKAEVSAALRTDDPVSVGRAVGYAEAAASLEILYKIVNHLLWLANKYSSLGLLQQLYAVMPLVLKQGKAFFGFMDALDKGAPIGDGVGPMSVGLLMLGQRKFEIAPDTSAALREIEGRRVLLIKAKGPASNLGNLDDAVQRARLMYGDISAIITIDAQLRLESERSGDTARGVGVAIGGIGVERFNIEERASADGIPVYAILVKESYVEAITPMTREIAEAVDHVHDALAEILRERVPQGGLAVVIGVGNTLGVAQ